MDKEELISALSRIQASLRITHALPIDSQSGNAIKLLLRSTTSHDIKIKLCQSLEAHYPVLLIVITLQCQMQTTYTQIKQLLQPVWETFSMSEFSARIYIDADGFIAILIHPESTHMNKMDEKQLAFALLHAIHNNLDPEAFLSVGPQAHSPVLLADGTCKNGSPLLPNIKRFLNAYFIDFSTFFIWSHATKSKLIQQKKF